MKIEHAWACFIAIIITYSLLNNWKLKKLDEKKNMQRNHYSNALNCSKFTIQHKTIIRLGLCVFIRKFVVATKYLETNYTFVKPICFLLIHKNKKINDKFFDKVWLYKTSTDILQTFSTIKLISEAHLETSGTFTIKSFCDFL